MKVIFVIICCFGIFVSISSCVLVENTTPAQEILVAYEAKNIGVTISIPVKESSVVEIDKVENMKLFKLQFPKLRWGRGLFLGCIVYRSNDPDDEDLIQFNRNGVPIANLSINQIKKFEYIILDKSQFYIIPNIKLEEGSKEIN